MRTRAGTAIPNQVKNIYRMISFINRKDVSDINAQKGMYLLNYNPLNKEINM